MVYGMQYHPVVSVLLFLAVACSAGCTNPISSPQEILVTPSPAILPTTESQSATVQTSEMALQLADLPTEYILRDRSVMISPEVSQLTRDVGWLQGYFVTFDRTGRIKSDQTRIHQAISIFPVENMNKVFTLEKDDLLHGGNSLTPSDEIPFPLIGNRSIACRVTDMPSAGQVTYTVIFTKKNVFERITMAGTSTDYETLKDLVQKAATKIR
jgi:hypothetical protein